jgi:FAD/FMN-containing dehydrogenase
VRDELGRVLGPRRFLVHEGHGDRLGVALPRTVAEVQQISRITREAKAPLIPRGASSSPFAGPEPREGLVVSFDQLDRIGAANARTRLVTVQPGAIWHTLIGRLAGRDLMPRVYPSSGGYSTVGGFVAQAGIGVGSYEFGDVGRTVAAVRIVDANGELRRLGASQSHLVVGAQGRTGLVVDILLRVQPRTPMAPLILLFDSLQPAEKAIADIAARKLPLWSVNLLDPAGSALANRNWPELAAPPDRYAMLVSFRAADAGAAMPGLRAVAAAAGGRVVEVARDAVDWIPQFASLQALGTTPLPMQFMAPLGRAAELVGQIPARLRAQLALEGVVADRGQTMALRLFFIEPAVSREHNAAAARQLLALAKQCGGAIYSTGAAYPEEAAATFGAERLRAIEDFRRLVDPDDRLNPGRAFAQSG